MKNERIIKGTFSSTTGLRLDYRMWLPEGEPKAVIQLVHGMAEHIDRYDATARALTEHGFAVVATPTWGMAPQRRSRATSAKRTAGSTSSTMCIFCASAPSSITPVCRTFCWGIPWAASSCAAT